jgi:prevent-host-death family protein
MSAMVNVHEAKTHFSKLLVRVEAGERIVIARAGKPVAVLGPVETKVQPRIPGNDAGLVEIMSDFDLPLPEFDE